MHKKSGPILHETKPQTRQFSYKLWLDSFAAYPYSCRIRPLEFFIVFKLQTVIKKNAQRANVTTIRVNCKLIDPYINCINCPLVGTAI